LSIEKNTLVFWQGRKKGGEIDLKVLFFVHRYNFDLFSFTISIFTFDCWSSETQTFQKSASFIKKNNFINNNQKISILVPYLQTVIVNANLQIMI